VATLASYFLTYSLAIVGLPSDIGGAGIQSDQLLRPRTATYHPGAGAVAVTVHERPEYWLGNLLVLDAPPRVDSVESWRAMWQREVADRSGAGHPLVHFEIPWRDRGAALACPTPAQIAVEWDTVFRAPPILTRQSTWPVRLVTTDLEWESVRALLAVDEVDLTATAEARDWQIDFLRWRLAMFRDRVATGEAAFFGAWHDASLVGVVGVLWSVAPAVARYQCVMTHPDHRRRGICSALLAAAQRHVADRADRGCPLIIISDHDSMQERLYASLGFEPVSLRVTWHLEDRT
jgi:GNAT superfamily N-acetyltransferase